MKLKDSFHPYALLTIVFWSLAYVFTRLALNCFSSFSLGFLRYFTASAVLLVFVLISKPPLPKKRDIPWFLLAGASGFFLYMVTFNQGQSQVSPSTASVVIATVPVITAALARVVYKEKLKPVQWAAVFIELSGVVVLTVLKSRLSLNTGLLWLFAAALLLSTYNLLQKKLTKKYSSLQVTAFSIFAGTLMLSVFAPAGISELKTAPPIQYLYLGILGVFSSAIAYISWAKAFSKAKKASDVSNYMFLTPLFTSVLGFVIIKEAPDLPTYIGGAIVLMGVLLFNLSEKNSLHFPKRKV